MAIYRQPEGQRVIAVEVSGDDFPIKHFYCHDARLGYVNCTSDKNDPLGIPKGYDLVAVYSPGYSLVYICFDQTQKAYFECRIGKGFALGKELEVPEGYKLVEAAANSWHRKPRLFFRAGGDYLEISNGKVTRLNIPERYRLVGVGQMDDTLSTTLWYCVDLKSEELVGCPDH